MEILDRRFLLDNVDGDPELLAEIVALFFENSAEILETVRAAVTKADPEGIHRSAHQLKGVLANVGAKSATELARELELIGRQGVLTGLETSFRSLESEMQKLAPELKQLVATVSDLPPDP